MLNNLKVGHKLWLLLSTLVIMMIVFEGIAYFNLYQELLNARKKEVKEQVENAYSLLSYYAKKESDIGQEAAQKEALAALSSLRYGNGGYFWVNDMQAKLLMHPLKPQLNGLSMQQETDANGKYHWQEMVKVVSRSGEGYVEYAYQGPQVTTPEEKVSYVKGYRPWGWIIGSGVFYSDVTGTFWKSFEVSASVEFILILIALVLCVIIIRHITHPLKVVSEHLQHIANGDMTKQIDMPRNDEIGVLATASNQVSSSLKETLSQVAHAIGELQAVCIQMRGNSKHTQAGMDNQFKEVELLATAMNEMSYSIKDVAQHAMDTAQATQSVQQITRQSSQDLDETNRNIQTLTHHVEGANDVIGVSV